MKHQPILTDAALEAMLARRAGLGAPAGLAGSITAALDALPPERRSWWSALAPTADAGPAVRMAWILAIVGLLLAVTVPAVFVGSQLLRRQSELPVVQPPIDDLTPLVLTPVGEPVVSDTVFGTITWRVYDGGPLGGLTGTPYGPVGLVDNDLRWLSEDGNWDGLALPWEAAPLTWDGQELFTSGSGLPRRLSWDGNRWVVGSALDVPAVVMPVELIATGPRGTIVFGEADLAIATDGRHFVATARPPASLDPNEPFVLATLDGFVALVTTDQSSWNKGAFGPVPWFSADGDKWERASAVSPFGEQAWIHGVAGRDGRFVAVGHGESRQGPWAAWVSDDGIAWERLVELGDPGGSLPSGGGSWAFVGVAAGEAGWVIYSKDGSAWASAEGRTWEPLSDWPAVRGMGWSPPEVAVAGDTIAATGYLPGRGGAVTLVGTIEPPEHDER